MLRRIYVHNYRCLENFEFKPNGQPSALLIGKNGSGKSTLLAALRVLQRIGRGANRVGGLVGAADLSLGRTSVPMRFEIEVAIGALVFTYSVALDLPPQFRELRVLEERLVLDGQPLFTREKAQVTVHRGPAGKPEAQFNIDWHLLALPVIQDPAAAGALGALRGWLASMILVSPIPKLMSSNATSGTEQLDDDASNWADWLAGLLERYPSAYSVISAQLREVLPDWSDLRFERVGKDAKSLLVRFQSGSEQFELSSDMLSDGEKCFFLCAVLLAANQCDGPLLTFWDEPDNHLSLGEVSQFVLALRRAFQNGGQLLMTSHNPEAIRRFSSDSTWVMGRRSHLEPTLVRSLQELAPGADLIQSLIDGDLDPWA